MEYASSTLSFASALQEHRAATDEAFRLPAVQDILPSYIGFDALLAHRKYCGDPESLATPQWYELENPKFKDEGKNEGSKDNSLCLNICRMFRFYRAVVERLIERCQEILTLPIPAMKSPVLSQEAGAACGAVSAGAAAQNNPRLSRGRQGTSKASAYMHCLNYIEALGWERGYFGAIISLQTEEQHDIAPKVPLIPDMPV